VPSMIYSIGYIYRRADLSRAAFRQHYETRHTQLAKELLPPFSHYVRNHVRDSAGVRPCPDSVSEFGYAQAGSVQTVAAILGDARGQRLREDELRFMDKSRNRSFAVTRQQWGRVPAPGAVAVEKTSRTKYILWPSAPVGSAPVDAMWERLRLADPALVGAVWCAPVDAAQPDAQPCWLCWSDAQREADQLWQRYNDNGFGLRCCASVDEVAGYPAIDG
jgi:EthD domain